MGLLKSLFGGEKREQPKSKNQLDFHKRHMNQLDEIMLINLMRNTRLFLSIARRCGISSGGVLRQFEQQDNLEEIDFYYSRPLNIQRNFRRDSSQIRGHSSITTIGSFKE